MKGGDSKHLYSLRKRFTATLVDIVPAAATKKNAGCKARTRIRRVDGAQYPRYRRLVSTAPPRAAPPTQYLSFTTSQFYYFSNYFSNYFSKKCYRQQSKARLTAAEESARSSLRRDSNLNTATTWTTATIASVMMSCVRCSTKSSQCTIVWPEECLGYGLVVPFHACGFALWFRIMKSQSEPMFGASSPFGIMKTSPFVLASFRRRPLNNLR